MRSTAYLGIALGTLWIAAGALADDSAPSTDSLAQMPPNPVTSPTTREKDAGPPANEGHRGRDKHASKSESASAAAAATTSATAATGDSATQPPAQPKKICRSMDVSGSKIPKRVCATQEEWATFNNHAREEHPGRLTSSPGSGRQLASESGGKRVPAAPLARPPPDDPVRCWSPRGRGHRSATRLRSRLRTAPRRAQRVARAATARAAPNSAPRRATGTRAGTRGRASGA